MSSKVSSDFDPMMIIKLLTFVQRCNDCFGAGLVETTAKYCQVCYGIKCISCNESGFERLPIVECSRCNGTGEHTPDTSDSVDRNC